MRAFAVAVAASFAAYALSVPPEPRFELASEKTLPAIMPPSHGEAFSVLSADGKSVLTARAGRLGKRKLDSVVEDEILPAGSISPAPFGQWIAWSPNERYVYYIQIEQSLPNLWRLDLKTHAAVCAIKNVSVASRNLPLLSPDGEKIAFQRGREMMLADADGSNQRPWCENCSFSPYSLAWSPESSRVLFTTFIAQAVSAPGKNSGPVMRVRVFDFRTGQTKELGSWNGIIPSIVWPAWDKNAEKNGDNGVFLCLWSPNTSAMHSWKNLLTHGEPRVLSPIWHLNIASGERTQVTQPPGSYLRMFGAGPDAFSLVADRSPEPITAWDAITNVFGVDMPSRAPTTVMLTLKK